MISSLIKDEGLCPTMETLAINPSLKFENPRLQNAYIALQAWKEAIISDPKNITGNWIGHRVCNYTGVFCWPAPDDPSERTVAGIDIKHADISGNLPHELGLLHNITLFHINSNRFCGVIPQSFLNLRLLYEVDLSNNHFAGKFPEILLQLPSLKYLDIPFNEYEGEIPREIFEREFDAIFINNNRFSSELPDNIGKSTVSVIVLANNEFQGCLPASLGNMAGRLNELIFTNNGLSSCFPSEIGKLKNLTVLDLSHNQIMGSLTESIGNMVNLEQLNLAHNMLSGKISNAICSLPKLKNFGYEYNFFSDEVPDCLKLPEFNDRRNCFRGRPEQRSMLQCQRFLSRKISCGSFECATLPPPCSLSPPPPIYSPPHPSPPKMKLVRNHKEFVNQASCLNLKLDLWRRRGGSADNTFWVEFKFPNMKESAEEEEDMALGGHWLLLSSDKILAINGDNKKHGEDMESKVKEAEGEDTGSNSSTHRDEFQENF
ncbi:unnamed protein product [Fraxinus pennsylvanica]|uniref:Cell wall hydroxyproline-rich glycoprotein n=1 Tax=Fraxinus pennsylvanica TaxID=56036 RepID=A0AAD1YSA7_9LAMI|nr:unnamed protein product [Fraxinus pennsylvanica]